MYILKYIDLLIFRQKIKYRKFAENFEKMMHFMGRMRFNG